MPTHRDLIGAHLLRYTADLPHGTESQHVSAWLSPRADSTEAAIVQLVYALGAYADARNSRAGSMLSQDGELGPVWRTLCENVRYLLRGDTGRLDAVAVGVLIAKMLREEGRGE